jgi:aspartate/methionine/tyrosine aminotransferase
MRLPDFALERWFARWEFAAPFLLGASDVEGCTQSEIVARFDDECRALWSELTLGYTPANGHPLLRREIASLYPGLDADDVMVWSGAGEAIFAAMNVCLSTGDHAIVTWPGYQSLYDVARSAGAEVTLLPLRAGDGWRLAVEELRRAFRPSTKMVVINFPHNPTGALCDRATLDAVIALCQESGALLFSDEVYRLLEERAEDRLPPAATLSPRALSLGVLSKAFGLAGLRIGWTATRDRALLDRLSAYKDYLSICSSAPSEVLALGALRAREPLLARSRAILDANLAELDRFFERRRGQLEWVRPRAGSVGFPRFAGGARADEFAEELAAKDGVMILPGSVYGFSPEHFRLGFGRVNLPQALQRFDAFLERKFA